MIDEYKANPKAALVNGPCKGLIPFHIATIFNKTEAMKLLINYSNPNSSTAMDETPAEYDNFKMSNESGEHNSEYLASSKDDIMGSTANLDNNS